MIPAKGQTPRSETASNRHRLSGTDIRRPDQRVCQALLGSPKMRLAASGDPIQPCRLGPHMIRCKKVSRYIEQRRVFRLDPRRATTRSEKLRSFDRFRGSTGRPVRCTAIMFGRDLSEHVITRPETSPACAISPRASACEAGPDRPRNWPSRAKPNHWPTGRWRCPS
jgi:hypothetical protein